MSIREPFGYYGHSEGREPPEPVDDLSREVPLVVDLDGTLLNSDLLAKSMSALVASSPQMAFRTSWRIRDGKAALKASLADRVDLELNSLPWNEAVVAFLLQQRARGRRLYLASAADRRWVQAVADKFRCFDGIFASDGIRNLAGRAKAAALREAFGERGFHISVTRRLTSRCGRRPAGRSSPTAPLRRCGGSERSGLMLR